MIMKNSKVSTSSFRKKHVPIGAITFLALKSRLEQTNNQYDMTLQYVRSTLDGLTCMNRSIHVIFMQEDKENKQLEYDQEELTEEHFDEHIPFVLLSRLTNVCLKLAKNIELLLRTPLSTGVSTLKSSHPVQRQESNASSISKQSAEDINDTTSNVYDDIIDKLNNEIVLLKTRLVEEELRTYVLFDVVKLIVIQRFI